MVAMPSYQQYLIRGNRSAATSYLLEVATMQERNLLDQRVYAVDMTALGATVPSNVSAHYTVATAGNNGTTPPSYTISAVPTGSQDSNDDCGTVTLNSLGTKGHEVGGTRCWE